MHQFNQDDDLSCDVGGLTERIRDTCGSGIFESERGGFSSAEAATFDSVLGHSTLA